MQSTAHVPRHGLFDKKRGDEMQKSAIKILTAVAAASMVLGFSAGCGSAVQNNATNSDAQKSVSKEVTGIAIGNQKIKNGGTLTIGLSSDPDKLDPTLSSSLYSRYVFQNTCEKLYDINSKDETVPLLASGKPKISSDGLTYSFNVRKGVKFGDGTAFNAAAVVKTLERDLTNKASARKTELGPITKVSATGEYSVQIDLSKPYAPLTAVLADRAGMIMSPKALDSLGDNFASAPVCVGAYKVVQRVPSTSITLEKDPNYYDAKDVHFDKIEYKIITDASIRAQNLKSGDIQVADSLTPQDASSVKGNSALSLMSVLSLGNQGIYINLANAKGVGQPTQQIDSPIAKNAKIREALDMSINRTQLVNSVFGGMYESACSFISPESPYASKASNTCVKYDPAKAKKLLKEAGVTTPYKIKVQVTNTSLNEQLMQAIQSQVKAGGFDLEIDPVEYTTLLSNVDQGTYGDAAQLGWSGRIDPDGNVTSFFKTGAAMNYAGYSNKTVDSLLTEAASTNDLTKRSKLYGEASQQLREDDPYIYLYRMRYLTGVSKKIAGVYVYGDGVLRVSHAAFLAK